MSDKLQFGVSQVAGDKLKFVGLLNHRTS